MNTTETALIVVETEQLVIGDLLGTAGAATNQAAAQGTFVNYRQRKSVRTLKAHDQDLARFVVFLSDVGVRADANALATQSQAWAGVTWGLVRGFALWQLQQGYSVASFNRAVSTVKVYAKLATHAGAISPDASRMIATVTGYSQKEARRIDTGRPASRRTTEGTPVKKVTSTVLTKAQAEALKQATNGRSHWTARRAADCAAARPRLTLRRASRCAALLP